MYPILFEFGVITVFSLWFFIMVGFIAGAVLLTKLSKRLRVKADIIAEHSIMLFLCTLVAARVFFILNNLDVFFPTFTWETFKGIFTIWDKGLSFWGAVIGWTACLAWIWRKEKIAKEESLRITDIIIPSVLLGMFFGNIGAFLDGINYGKPTTLPWGIAFRSANVKYITPLHPTEVYAALYALGISLLLIYGLKSLRGRIPGLITQVGLLLFSLAKLCEEFFRGDDTLMVGSFRISMIFSFVGVVVFSYLLFQTYMNKDGRDPDGLLKKIASRIRACAHKIFTDGRDSFSFISRKDDEGVPRVH